MLDRESWLSQLQKSVESTLQVGHANLDIANQPNQQGWSSRGTREHSNWSIKKEVGSPPKQIYIPKKKEVLAAPMDAIEQTSLRICSMEALLNEIEEGPIVIENLAL